MAPPHARDATDAPDSTRALARPPRARPLQVSLEFLGGSSGPSYSVPRLSRALREAGAASRMAGLRWPWMPAAEDSESERGFAPSRPLVTRGASAPMRRYIANSIQSGDSNILHCHSIWLMPPVYCAAAAKQAGCPFVVSPRGTLSPWAFRRGSPLKRIAWPLLQRRAVESATCFHATSMEEADDIRRFGFQQPIAVVPNGIDIPDTAAGISGREHVALFLGRIHPKKGLEDLLEAWESLAPRFPKWSVEIAGPVDSDYARLLQDRSKSTRLPRLHFVGELSGESKWAAFRRASVFVLPTRSENFGIAVAESLANGTAVVVSKGAPWERVIAERCGWWHDIGTSGLRNALSEALQRPIDELHQMGATGRAWMARDFAWNSVATQMKQVYEWLVGGGNRPDTIV
jgi:glycosyltransferase involved in cell wall biosynthesis